MAFFRSQSIRVRLFNVLLIAIGGVTVIAVGIWRIRVEPALRMGVAKEQRQLARRVADQIDEFLDHRIAELLITVEVSRFWEDERDRQKESLYRLLKLDPLVHEISVADREGRVILRLSRTRVYSESDLISLGQDDAFQQALQGKNYVGEVYHAPTSEPFVTLAVPIKFTATEIRGVVMAEVSLKTLWDSISHIKVGQSGHAFVVDQEGRLIAHPDSSKVLLGMSMAHLQEVREFLSDSNMDPDLGEVIVGQDGKKVISTFAVARKRPWGVFVEEPAVTALAEVDAVERFAGLMGFFMLAGAFGLSYWFSARITRPIRQLEEGTKLIARGNLEHKLEIHTGDEIENLACYFNEMAQALKTSYEGLEAKIAERTKEISALYGALTPLVQTGSLNEMLDKVIVRLMEGTGSDAALIRVLDKTTGNFIQASQQGFPERYLKEAETKAAGSAVDSVFTTGQPIISSDIELDSRWKERFQLRVGFCSCALLPLSIAGEMRGVIHLASRKTGHFTEEKRDYLLAIARQMGIAMENKELFEEAQRSLERIRALREIDRAVTSTLDLHEVLDVLLEKIDILLPYSAATIRLLNKESGLLEPVACRNLDEEEWKADQWRGGRGIPNVVFANKAPWMASNVQTDPNVRDREFFRKHGLVSYLGVPLIVKDEALGVLSFYTKQEHEFPSKEVEFLTTLAGQVAIAVHNAQLYEQTKNQALELRRLNKVKNEFLSVMSHELRTPLNVVVGYTEMIRDGMLGSATSKQEAALEKIINQARDQLTMISSILQATQIEAGGIRVESREFNLRAFLDELSSSIEVPLGKDLELVWDYPSDLPSIATDREKLKHVLQNLIHNAIKFTSRGVVTVSARCSPGAKTVEFEVKDTGIGIPEELQPFIFEMFRQGDSSETRPYGGVGLGLFIVKKWTELLGGSVRVESKPGSGSSFTVTLGRSELL